MFIAIYLNKTNGKRMKINTVKAFKSFKNLKKMLKAASATQTAAAVIDEISTQDHSETWDFAYYDRKFYLIGGQLNLMTSKLETLFEYIDQIEHKISNNKLNTIVLSTVAFICISGTFILAVYLVRKTANSSYQKRMNNLLKVVKATREECQQKLNVLNARQDLEQMQDCNNEIRQGINSLQAPIQSA